jgi:hypothetical protein
MNQLTTLRLAYSHAVLRPRGRAVPVAAVRAMQTFAPSGRSPHGLICTWTRNPATGRLECAWSPMSEQDRCSVWRPGRRVMPVLRPLERRAA